MTYTFVARALSVVFLVLFVLLLVFRKPWWAMVAYSRPRHIQGFQMLTLFFFIFFLKSSIVDDGAMSTAIYRTRDSEPNVFGLPR